jgi:hypothetical protein
MLLSRGMAVRRLANEIGHQFQLAAFSFWRRSDRFEKAYAAKVVGYQVCC